MFNPIPFSVRMRAAGFVFDKHVRSMNIYDKWVPKGTTIADKRNYATKVDHTVDILARFVAKWTLQSRKARREYRIREAGRKWRDAALKPNWADLSEAHERREAELARRQFDKYVLMSEADWKAACRDMIEQHKAAGKDILPLIRSVITPVWEARDRAAALAVVNNAQVWVELNAAPRLHNTQRPAQVRVSRNRFAIDSDSE